jgi:hypothetical protein
MWAITVAGSSEDFASPLFANAQGTTARSDGANARIRFVLCDEIEFGIGCLSFSFLLPFSSFEHRIKQMQGSQGVAEKPLGEV